MPAPGVPSPREVIPFAFLVGGLFRALRLSLLSQFLQASMPAPVHLQASLEVVVATLHSLPGLSKSSPEVLIINYLCYCWCSG